VELRHEPEAADALTRVGVWDDTGRVATLTVVVRDGRRHVGVGLAAPLALSRADARALVDAIPGLADDGTGDGPLVVHVSDDLVRDEARRAGWTGALRGELQPSRADTRVSDGNDGLDEATVVAAIDALVPDAAVSIAVAFGLGARPLTLKVTDPGGRRALRLRLPRRDDLMPESLASAIDTTLAVKERFGRIARGVSILSFDHGGPAFDSGEIAGSTWNASGTVFLNPNLACADALVEQRARSAARGGHSVSASVPAPFTALDGVTAHELWHNLDSAIQVSGTYVQFNRALGEALGVATLEHALRGGEHDAPPEWQAARYRLATEVSPYATTNPRECTAEMFKLWWCSNGNVTPVVARFGELVDEYYPRAGGR
jgi:hypothetical protein